MSIGRDEIMHIARASEQPPRWRLSQSTPTRPPRDDAWVMWLIIGGWAFVVATLNFLSEIQAWLAR